MSYVTSFVFGMVCGLALAAFMSRRPNNGTTTKIKESTEPVATRKDLENLKEEIEMMIDGMKKAHKSEDTLVAEKEFFESNEPVKEEESDNFYEI